MVNVSIIIPVYNAEAYLNQCLKSVIDQNYKNFEIIIIDDGSVDKTYDIAMEWRKRDDRINVFKNTDKGVSSARNYGIKRATGEWILFLDSDDLMASNMVNYMLTTQQSHKCECVSVLYTSEIQDLCVNEVILSPEIVETPDTYKLLTHCKKNIGGFVWNKLYNRRIIMDNNILFDLDVASGEDILFNIQYFKYIDKMAVLDEKLYYYRLSETSAVNRLDNSRWFDIVNVYERIMNDDIEYKVKELFLYDFIQLILEAIYRKKYCSLCTYTDDYLATLKRKYFKLSSTWGIKKNLKLLLFLLFPNLSMKYKRRNIKS